MEQEGEEGGMAAEGVVDLLEHLQGSLWGRETAPALLSISPSEEGWLLFEFSQ